MEEADAGQDGEAAAAPPVASLDLSNVRGFQALPGAGDAPADALDEETRQRELAKEFSARAARFAEAVDDAIVLANDGAIRWLGDPVAKIVAGEETLKPRAVILADDALPAEGRQAAEHRVELWLSAHVRKTLGPLLTLLEPESVPEAVRDIALKLSQSLGILERERVKSQVKALDQNARGALRKLGVRFGAHYLYVPALLKPAARALCAQLWALSRGEADKEAVAEKLLHFASSGRTSFAVEGPASGEVYRVAGFRLCGERAVRVDIVERLTDLIRAALPRHLTANPAAEGEASPIGFVVTNQMTSLTGCSGEHFASILRSLGFASHQVKKSAYLAALKAAQPAPVEPVVAPAAEVTTAEAPVAGEGEQAASDAPSPHDETSVVEPTGEVSDAPALEVAEPEPAEAEAVAEALAPPDAEELAPATDSEEPAVAEIEAPSVDAAPSNDAEPSAAASEAAPGAEPPSDPLASETAAAVEAAAGEEDELIEIWRPAPRRPRPVGKDHRRPPHRHGQGAPSEGPSQDRQPRKPWRDRPRPQGEQSRQEGARAGEAPAQNGEARPASEQGREGRRQPWRRDGAKGPRPDENRNAEAGADKAKPRQHPEPRKPSVNLDSPFAKLLDLKPLLKSRDSAK